MVLFADGSLSGGEAGDGHAERRAGHVVQANLVAERDGRRIAAVLAADAEFEIRIRLAAELAGHLHELAEQEKSDAILNITSSETERVSIDAFEYMKDGNQGYRMESADGLAAVAYEGDCVKLCLKYYDSILGDTPQVTDDLIYSYTFERYDSDYGIYRAIYDADDTSGYWDYATLYPPEFHFADDSFTLYIPLTSGLEDGRYKLYFSYEDPATQKSVFQATIEFYLNRSAM